MFQIRCRYPPPPQKKKKKKKLALREKFHLTSNDDCEFTSIGVIGSVDSSVNHIIGNTLKSAAICRSRIYGFDFDIVTKSWRCEIHECLAGEAHFIDRGRRTVFHFGWFFV